MDFFLNNPRGVFVPKTSTSNLDKPHLRNRGKISALRMFPVIGFFPNGQQYRKTVTRFSACLESDPKFLEHWLSAIQNSSVVQPEISAKGRSPPVFIWESGPSCQQFVNLDVARTG